MKIALVRSGMYLRILKSTMKDSKSMKSDSTQKLNEQLRMLIESALLNSEGENEDSLILSLSIQLN